MKELLIDFACFLLGEEEATQNIIEAAELYIDKNKKAGDMINFDQDLL